MNAYLQDLSKKIYDCVKDIPEVSISRFYRPMQWLPHITMGKKLTKEQMKIAFEVMQKQFAPLEATVTQIGLAKVNHIKTCGRWIYKKGGFFVSFEKVL